MKKICTAIRRKCGQRPPGARAGQSPAELIAELRQAGPVAIQKWAYQFRMDALDFNILALAQSASRGHSIRQVGQ
jgi:hypothetical protein